MKKIFFAFVIALFLASCNTAPKKESSAVVLAANGLPIGKDVGFMAPEIELPTAEGIPVKLSSLQGKYVLIDFWASWCPPCRAEIPHLTQLYSAYKNKGLEIYGVSLDKDKDRWLKAVEDYKMQWIHVSDLKKWGSQPVEGYGIEGIPANFILDKEGKIIAKDLHGTQLEDFLKKLLN
ncbi:redoxin domain-containing protein [Solitalea canadensis]|nr:redoxin domain-containing protein [Solitalea canadensis]